ncbi:MAG: Cell division protein FtsQ [Fimbriimonadales bacterium]|nr:Cell division protein FtsQ [Fimbriimonadales bacterium]
MASRRKSKRRRRAPVPWGVVWIIAFVAVTSIGLYTSQLTRITSVRVLAAPYGDKQRLLNILKKLEPLPALQVDSTSVQRSIESKRFVRDSQFTRNVFGRAVLKVEYRKPVAWIRGTTGWFVDEEGVVFPSRGEKSPPIGVDKSVLPRSPLVTLGGPGLLQDAALLAKAVQESGLNLHGVIWIDERVRLCLNSSLGAKVTFGSGKDLDLKLKALKQALASEPSLLESAKEVNLVVPDAPAVTR